MTRLSDDVPANFVTVITAANLGIRKFYLDVPPYTSDDLRPSLVVWYKRHRESRMSGGSGNGDKLVRFTMALILTTGGNNQDSDADGITHRQLVEDIVSTIRTTAVTTLGCQVSDQIDWDRQPPLADEQGIAYLTYIEFHCEAYVSG